MNLYITKYCSIARKKILVNDGVYYLDEHECADSEFLTGLYKLANVNYPKFHKMDALSKTGFLTCEILLRDTVYEDNTPKPGMGMFFMNKYSSLDTDKEFQRTISGEYFPSPSVFVYTLPNICMGEIAIRYKIFGENTFFVSEGFDFDNTWQYVVQSFLEGKMSSAIIGWVDFYCGRAESLLMLVEKDSGGQEFTVENVHKLWNGKENIS